MPFENQFALSLEVSRLLPVKLVGDKATEVVMQLARSLQNSGSDIVVEEDLAQIFGKSHIAPRCESSFKTVVVGNAGTSQLYNTIFLQKGPGPTVARAISNPPYLATVIQLSLLSWVHDNSALAAAIAGAMEKRTEDAPVDYSARSAPAQEDIAGVITACDEQTAAFKWNQLLFATAATLGVPRPEATEALNPVIIRGALDMFPMVQKLYEDRLIHVEQHSGLCVLVVWAHHVLGLTTVVRFPDGREKRLGTGTEQILIEMKADYSSTTSIILLDSKGGDVLLRIQSDQDDFQIESAGRIDAQGYGTHWLKEYCWGIPALEEEMQQIIVAFSMIISKHLRKDTKWPEPKSTEPARSLIQAAQFLFDNEQITHSAVEDFVKLYSTGQPFDRSDPPETLQAVCRGNASEGITQATQLWHDMLGNTRCLVVLLLVFSHVRQLEVGARLPLRAPMDMFDHPLVDALAGWDGRSEIVIEDDTWFYGIALLLMGPAALKDPYLDTVSLLSARGWSVHLNVYGNDDPSTRVRN